MAPKGGRGGGSGGGGSSISACPDAFWMRSSQIRLANIVIFLAAFFGIAIALCIVRKKNGANKKLLGWPYVTAVVLFILSFSLQLILAVLVECGAFNLDAAAGIGIVIDISWSLGSWLLFFIVVYVLNTLLRQELGGAIAIYKVICLAITGVMLALACADAGISSYNDWTMSSAGYEANAEAIEYPWLHLLLAEYVLLLVGVLVSGALSLMTIFALRSRRLPGGGLLIWVTVLISSMVIWYILHLVHYGSLVAKDIMSPDTYRALPFVRNFFLALSFIILLCVAKHSAWNKTTIATPVARVYSPVRV